MKVYSKYLIIFSLTFLLCSLLHIGLFYYNLGKPEPSIEQLNQRFLKKDNYAKSIKERKIMFISGSNTLFGVDTEKLEHALHIPVVNYGIHA